MLILGVVSIYVGLILWSVAFAVPALHPVGAVLMVSGVIMALVRLMPMAGQWWRNRPGKEVPPEPSAASTGEGET
jgi:hypothetical protein